MKRKHKTKHYHFAHHSTGISATETAPAAQSGSPAAVAAVPSQIKEFDYVRAELAKIFVIIVLLGLLFAGLKLLLTKTAIFNPLLSALKI